MAGSDQRVTVGQRNARRLVRPGPLMVAAAILWAAANEPTGFTLSSTIVWVLGSLTIAILARAALALLQPLAKLGVALLLQGVPQQAPKAEDEH
jgi:hypothetical protein